VIDRADLLDMERRALLAGLLVNSTLDQAIVLATSTELPPSRVPMDVKFVNLMVGTSLQTAALAASDHEP
jgi:hypothetical protein